MSQVDLLGGARIAIVQTEGKLDQQHIEAAEADHRPGAHEPEGEADEEGEKRNRHHQNAEAAGP